MSYFTISIATIQSNSHIPFGYTHRVYIFIRSPNYTLIFYIEYDCSIQSEYFVFYKIDCVRAVPLPSLVLLKFANLTQFVL